MKRMSSTASSAQCSVPSTSLGRFRVPGWAKCSCTCVVYVAHGSTPAGAARRVGALSCDAPQRPTEGASLGRTQVPDAKRRSVSGGMTSDCLLRYRLEADAAAAANHSASYAALASRLSIFDHHSFSSTSIVVIRGPL